MRIGIGLGDEWDASRLLDDSWRRPSLSAVIPICGSLSNKRCSRQAPFGSGFAAMVVACLQLN